jgi:hypothetical protein
MPAVEIFERLLSACPDHPSYLLNLGLACKDAGQPDRASAYLSRLLIVCSASSAYARHAERELANM